MVALVEWKSANYQWIYHRSPGDQCELHEFYTRVYPGSGLIYHMPL